MSPLPSSPFHGFPESSARVEQPPRVGRQVGAFARTPAPLPSGPWQLGTAVCSLIRSLSSPVRAALGWPLAMTGEGSQPCRGSGLALGWTTLVPATWPLCSQPSLVLVGAVVWDRHAVPGLSEPLALPPDGHTAPVTVALLNGVCSTASPQLWGWLVWGVGSQAL